MKEVNSIKLRILKTWLSDDYALVLQCQNPFEREDSEAPKKVFFIIDLKQESFGLRLTEHKPLNTSANHAFVQILRKHCPSFTLKEIYFDPEQGAYWMPLLRGASEDDVYMLLVQKTRPPLLCLVSPQNETLVAFGQKGTFTKRHPSLLTFRRDMCRQEMSKFLGTLQNPTRSRGTLQSTEEQRSAPQSELTFSAAQKEIASRLKRKLKTVRKTLTKIKNDLPPRDLVENSETNAKLFQAYAYLVKEGDYLLRLSPEQSGKDDFIELHLDPEKSIGQQIELCFKAAKRLRRSLDFGRRQQQEAEEGIKSLEFDLQGLQSRSYSEAEIRLLVERYKLPELRQVSASSNETTSSKPYKIYISSTGHKIYVGKGAHDNDILTKQARGNDYWLHAIGAQGSHVIIPVTPDIRQSPPTQLIRDAAILALHFSRFREDMAGECYVTRKNNIRKKKGMPPGLWLVDQAETIFFRYSQSELLSVLETVSL